MSGKCAPSFLIVDGNNAIHAWDVLKVLHRKRRGMGHVELCRRLRQFSDQSDYRVVVVFDGRSRSREEVREPEGLQIIYTDGGSTADDAIERLVSKYSARYRLVVATNDLAERNMVEAMGAEVWSVETLRAEVERVEGNWQDYLR